MAANPSLNLCAHANLGLRQRFEVGELFGFETRNKYEIIDAQGTPIGFCAEQSKGLGGFLLRQFLGHWRTFTLHFFDAQRQPVMTATHPFRFWFQRLEIDSAGGQHLGAIQQRFSILSKTFHVENAVGSVLFEVNSPLWSPWTYAFYRNGKHVASVRKRWSGLFSEGFTDKDRFSIEFMDPALPQEQRQLLLAAGVFIDLKYFERKAR
jgi:uncharacterized protein YxjI